MTRPTDEKLAIMDVLFLIWSVAATVTSVESYCRSTSLYASTYSQSKSITSDPYDHCTITITFGYAYSRSSYYLEISWSSFNFDIKGNMPLCKEDYVEVFLTSSYKSIGKFCSNNAGKPFTMYSLDSFAKITYRTDGSATGRGFTFFYKLKSKKSGYLGDSPSSTFCKNTYNYGGSGVIYSTGWPSGYQQSLTPCNYKISRAYPSHGVYVVFMDVNMFPYGSDPLDCVQLYGSNRSHYYTRAISSRLCNIDSMKKYITYDQYLKITFDRKNRETYRSSRGFVAGFVVFKKPTAILYTTPIHRANTTRYTKHTVGSSTFINVVVIVVVATLVPGIVITAIVIGVYKGSKRKQRSNAAPVSFNQYESSANQQSFQTTPLMYNPSNVPTEPHFPYPTAVTQIGSHHTVSYLSSHPNTSSSPAVQCSTVGNEPLKFSFVVYPSNNPAPAGPNASSVQMQQAVGAISLAPTASASPSRNLPNIVEQVVPSPTAPTTL